jgi:hypothetical protein
MNVAIIFNYFESALWFGIALTVFLRRNTPDKRLKKLAMLVSMSFTLFGLSDIVEASTGAWWRPLWLLGVKGLCVLSFVCCWIKYHKIKSLQ